MPRRPLTPARLAAFVRYTGGPTLWAVVLLALLGALFGAFN